MRLAAALLLSLAAVIPAHAEIVVGVLAPLSGVYAPLGEEIRDGAAQAVEAINSAGGVNGEPLKLEAMDDRCDARTADAAANQMAGKGAKLVVGDLCLGASQAAAAVFAANDIVQIAPGTMHPSFTDNRAGPGVFRICGRDDQQGIVAGRFLAAHFPKDKIAILDDKSPYGKSLADATRQAMNAAGVHETLTDSYDQGQKSYNDLAGTLADAGIGVVFIGGHPAEAGLIARAMKDAGMTTTLVSGDALLAEAFWNEAGDASDGAIATYPPDAARDPANAGLVATLKAAGVAPEGYVFNAYAAVQVWAAAASTAGTVDFDRVVSALAAGSFDTVIGKVAFDAKGDSTLPAYVPWIWSGGNYAPLTN
jgi:branched-chain amino acid transport system substrate-binding protein